MNPAEPVTTDNDTIDVIALWRLLWGNRFLLAAVAGVFGIAAVVYALLLTPIYRAEVVITPVAGGGLADTASSLAGRFGGLASLAGIDLGNSGVAGQEAQAVLESRRLVEEFVRRNDLVDVLVPPGSEQSTVWYAAKTLRESVASITKDDLDGTTTVAVDWKDPQVAAAWANGLVALANDLLRTKAIADSNRNIEYLNKQIAATSVVEMQRVLYGLIQNEMQTLMLANARVDYAFTVVDPAVVPEARSKPKRRLIVVTGVAIGLALGALFIFGRDTVRRYREREAGGTSRP